MGAVPDLDLLKIRKYCEEKTPQKFRSEMRVEVEVRGKSVTVFESRPPWDKQGTEWSRLPIGQLRYDPATARWTLFWADRNSRWHPYDIIDPGTVEELLGEIEKIPPASSGASSWGPIELSPATELLLKHADWMLFVLTAWTSHPK